MYRVDMPIQIFQLSATTSVSPTSQQHAMCHPPALQRSSKALRGRHPHVILKWTSTKGAQVFKNKYKIIMSPLGTQKTKLTTMSPLGTLKLKNNSTLSKLPPANCANDIKLGVSIIKIPPS